MLLKKLLKLLHEYESVCYHRCVVVHDEDGGLVSTIFGAVQSSDD